MEPSIIKLLSEKKVIGLRQVNRGIKDDQIRCVLIAEDTEPHIRQELLSTCRKARIPIKKFASKEEMGKMLGIDVACATVGILK